MLYYVPPHIYASKQWRPVAIGQYNTCPHQCEYCYANASKDLATENWHRHQLEPHSELIIPQDNY